MSVPEALVYNPHTVSRGRRIVVHIAVILARLLATRPPSQIRSTLRWLRRGARPATGDRVYAARGAVVAVSMICAAPEGCLPRSLATVFLCRLHGEWPTWCVGVRRLPPFAAHAWVEVDGDLVGEDYPPAYFKTLMTVA